MFGPSALNTDQVQEDRGGVGVLMRADAAKELVTLSYINYEGELRYEWLEVVTVSYIACKASY